MSGVLFRLSTKINQKVSKNDNLDDLLLDGSIVEAIKFFEEEL